MHCSPSHSSPSRGKKTRYLDTYNLIVTARKTGNITLDKQAAHNAAEKLLRSYLVDNSDTEEWLMAVWMAEFDAQFGRSMAEGV
jgi:hypothetical protein